MSPDVCRRWLPVWLPVISLAPLTLMPHLPTEDAGVAVATARPAPHPAHMPTWPAGTGSDCGRPVVLPPHSSARQAKGCRCGFPPRRIDARSCRDGCGRATDARIALLTRRMRWAAGVAGSPGFAMQPARIRSARWILRAWCRRRSRTGRRYGSGRSPPEPGEALLRQAGRESRYHDVIRATAGDNPHEMYPDRRAPGSRTSLPRKNAPPRRLGPARGPSQCHYIGMAS